MLASANIVAKLPLSETRNLLVHSRMAAIRPYRMAVTHLFRRRAASSHRPAELIHLFQGRFGTRDAPICSGRDQFWYACVHTGALSSIKPMPVFAYWLSFSIQINFEYY